MPGADGAQTRFGASLMTLVEDPGSATVLRIAQEAAAVAQAAASSGAFVPASDTPVAVPGCQWIAPCPVSVKLRLFCLPYAGGVSENVYSRRAPALHDASPGMLPRDAASLCTGSWDVCAACPAQI